MILRILFYRCALLATAITLGACTRTKLPESTSSMADIYVGSDVPVRSAASQRAVHGGHVDLSPYTREAGTELTTRFPRVANPTLVMYVFPHLSRDMPVPGYVTTFSMWDSAPFALPGETADSTDEILP